MKRKIFMLLPALACVLILTGCCFHSQWYAATCEAPKTCTECGETEGEPLGHSWVDATCTAPKTCSACHKAEGEALGHSWVDATTEAPKTCTVCAATEGERIVTDPRFTTAATADLQGQWLTDLSVPSDMFGISGFEGTLDLQISLTLGNDGTMGLGYLVTNNEEFTNSLTAYLESTLYAELEATGLDREAADAAMVDIYGMTVPEFVADVMAQLDFAAVFDALDITGVYYVEDGQFYSGISWDLEMEPSQFTLDGDTLVLAEELSGITEESVTFTRTPK